MNKTIFRERAIVQTAMAAKDPRINTPMRSWTDWERVPKTDADYRAEAALAMGTSFQAVKTKGTTTVQFPDGEDTKVVKVTRTGETPSPEIEGARWIDRNTLTTSTRDVADALGLTGVNQAASARVDL